jgi:hypothetical protein
MEAIHGHGRPGELISIALVDSAAPGAGDHVKRIQLCSFTEH